MNAVFADTSYFVALCGSNDAYHGRALALSERLKVAIITTEYVLVEMGGLMLRPEDRPTYVNLVRDLESDPLVQIVPGSQVYFWKGFELFSHRPDKYWSLVDCLSFVVMKQRRLRVALTTDHHFEQAGFRALLREKLTDQGR